MNSKQTALMPGNEDKVGYWLTPPDLMAKLQAEFDFNFDACPYPRPAGFDGLKERWGTRTYVNPPFVGSSPKGWIDRSVSEVRKGHLVVLALPVDRWFAWLIKSGVNFQIRYEGNVAWGDPLGRHRRSSRPTCFFILRPKP